MYMDIRWIKLAVQFYKDEDIRLIRKTLPDGDTIALMFVMLLALAGDRNQGGDVPFTDEELAVLFDIQVNTVRLGIRVMLEKGMIDDQGGVLHISNWDKYQSMDGMERIREQSRESSKRYRERKKGLEPAAAAPALPAPAPDEIVATLPLVKTGEFHSITKSDVQKYRDLYPGIDVMQEIRKMIGWCDANPKNRKTKAGVKRFINNWLSRAQDRAPRQPVPQAEPAFIPPPPANNGLEDWDEWNK